MPHPHPLSAHLPLQHGTTTQAGKLLHHLLDKAGSLTVMALQQLKPKAVSLPEVLHGVNQLTPYLQDSPPTGLPGQVPAHSPTITAGKTVRHKRHGEHSLLRHLTAPQHQSWSLLGKNFSHRSLRSSQNQAARALSMSPLRLPSDLGAIQEQTAAHHHQKAG